MAEPPLCASLSQPLKPGLPLDDVSASLGGAGNVIQLLCGPPSSAAQCIQAIYPCTNGEGHRVDLWIFFGQDAGSWRVIYWREHAAKDVLQRSI